MGGSRWYIVPTYMYLIGPPPGGTCNEVCRGSVIGWKFACTSGRPVSFISTEGIIAQALVRSMLHPDLSGECHVALLPIQLAVGTNSIRRRSTICQRPARGISSISWPRDGRQPWSSFCSPSGFLHKYKTSGNGNLQPDWDCQRGCDGGEKMLGRPPHCEPV